MRFWASLFSVLLLSATPAPKEHGFDAFGVPLLSFNSDTGVGFGAVGGAYFYAPGYTPFRHAVSAQIFATTQGVQNHFLRYDGPQLFLNLRAEAKIEWRKELLSPYFGPGNQASLEFDEAPNLDDKKWNYRKNAPGAWARIRFRPLGASSPLESYLGYVFRWTSIEVFPDSLLAAQMPPGVSGGPTGQVLLGFQWDTRDSEGNPTKGNVHELSFRGAHAATGSRYEFGGVTLVTRHFQTLGTPKLIFAQRVLLDGLFGDVPFFEWPNTGGLAPAEGVGGLNSVRGIVRQRFVGNFKAFTNSEIRYFPFSFSILKVPTHVGALAFFDLGRAWHPGIDSGSFWKWHPSVGAGIRLARRQAVVRFDTGYAIENRRLAIYVTFGHLF